MFALLEHLVSIYISPRVWWQLWCIMYGTYVYIVAVTYVAFLNKCDFFSNWSARSTRGIVKHVFILVLCTYIVFDVLPCQLNMALDYACWKMQQETYVTMWKENYQKQKNCEWTNGVLTNYVNMHFN